ncbi:MAG: HIT family protein [Actinomycetaceae bacterium]|nr:HIT family protein [Actinomycetaceae bacterium]
MTVFEMIIAGEIPGRFVYADDKCVVFATIEPVRPGHVLVVPREPAPAWTDLSADDAAHLFKVAQRIGKAQLEVFDCERIGLTIAGFEVPHTHLHVIPLRLEADLALGNAREADGDALESTMQALRGELENQGLGANVPPSIDSAELN